MVGRVYALDHICALYLYHYLVKECEQCLVKTVHVHHR